MTQIIFNPDPKLQAQAMIQSFKPMVCSHHRRPLSYDGETADRMVRDAKSCALISARMCIGAVAYHTKPTDVSPELTAHYWERVIEELEKL